MNHKLLRFLILVAALTGISACSAQTESQLIRLSKLSITALQCTYLTKESADSARLFAVGLEAGRRYVELAQRDKEAFRKASDYIPGIYLQLDGPSADFVVGRAQGMVRARLDFDEIEAVKTGAAPHSFRPSEYKNRDCANLQLK